MVVFWLTDLRVEFSDELVVLLVVLLHLTLDLLQSCIPVYHLVLQALDLLLQHRNGLQLVREEVLVIYVVELVSQLLIEAHCLGKLLLVF